jgi:RNA polymerase sigma factor (TIGR02999 family)
MSDVTRILSQIERGDPQAAEKLLPLVYDELRKLAAVKLAQEQPGQTLEATALVHEAYLRLVGSKHPHPGPLPEGGGVGQKWDGRRHFFAAAAMAMRRILIENARRKDRLKHGGQFNRLELDDLPQSIGDERLLALDKALTELAAEDPQVAQVVELHHFAGLSHDLVSETLGITAYQARQKWTYARAWLLNALAAE